MFYDISFSDQKIEFKERLSSLIIAAVAWWFLAFATDFQVKVIHLTDGDSLTLLNEANEQVGYFWARNCPHSSTRNSFSVYIIERFL